MLVTRTCKFCGKRSRLDVDETAIRKWNNGMLIQEAFKDIVPEIREILLTGTCLSCQEKIFKEEEDVN